MTALPEDWSVSFDTAFRFEAWMDDALCANADPTPFFPERGGSTRAAKRICSACPVREECLAFALRNEAKHTDFGIWGGMGRRERRALRRGEVVEPPVPYEVPTSRVCKTCGVEKPMSEYHSERSGAARASGERTSGHKTSCKACKCEQDRERRAPGKAA